MGRRVKCYATGEYGSSEQFVKIDGKYYKSQDVYEKYKANQESRNKCLDGLLEIMGYGNGKPVNTLIFRKLKDWSQYYNWNTISRSVALSRSSIQRAERVKQFSSEGARLSYMLAIVNNNLEEAYKEQESHRERQTLKEAPEDLDIISAAPKKESVAKFLDEGDELWT